MGLRDSRFIASYGGLLHQINQNSDNGNIRHSDSMLGLVRQVQPLICFSWVGLVIYLLSSFVATNGTG